MEEGRVGFGVDATLASKMVDVEDVLRVVRETYRSAEGVKTNKERCKRQREHLRALEAALLSLPREKRRVAEAQSTLEETARVVKDARELVEKCRSAGGRTLVRGAARGSQKDDFAAIDERLRSCLEALCLAPWRCFADEVCRDLRPEPDHDLQFTARWAIETKRSFQMESAGRFWTSLCDQLWFSASATSRPVGTTISLPEGHSNLFRDLIQHVPTGRLVKDQHFISPRHLHPPGIYRPRGAAPLHGPKDFLVSLSNSVDRRYKRVMARAVTEKTAGTAA